VSRAVIYDQFGGPEVLEVRDVPEPHPGEGEIRVRVTAAGLNPMDWGISARPGAAARFGVTLPAGFGCDLAGVVDEVGTGVEGYAVGDRVYGGAMAKAVADFAIVPAAPSALYHLMPTPDGISDEAAAALPTPGLAAAAALGAIGLQSDDTALIGGAAGGVGVLAVQLARLVGARVIGTASPSTFGFLRELGTEPVEYGPGSRTGCGRSRRRASPRRPTCSGRRPPRRRSRSASPPIGSRPSPPAPTRRTASVPPAASRRLLPISSGSPKP